MAILISKTTNLRFKIEDTQDPTKVKYFPVGECVISCKGHDKVVISYPDRPFVRALEVDITDLGSTSNTSIGNATFAHATDLWTKATHGLKVGDRVRFSAVGTGATGYAANTNYFVVAAPDNNTFQLSTTQGGSILTSDADSVGTWTLVRYSATDRAAQIEAL
jgi:hypothetical protein